MYPFVSQLFEIDHHCLLDCMLITLIIDYVIMLTKCMYHFDVDAVTIWMPRAAL